MYLPGYRRFSPPSTLGRDEQVKYCVSVIHRYQQELPTLRMSTSVLKRQRQKAVQEVGYWKEKYQREKQEKDKLKREVDRLKREIERLTKTANRYQVALFDHGNFKSPDAKDKKPKGGQPGHTDTNREGCEDRQGYQRVRVFACRCPDCGQPLSRVKSTQQKLLLDVVVNPQAVKMIIDSERQWCGKCRKEVNAKDDRSLPFTEYGINTFMVALLLRYRCHLPLAKVSLVLEIGYGLRVSPGSLTGLLRQAKNYLKQKYDRLKQSIRGGKLIYTDETGWQVRGKNVWMWIMASEEATVYVAAESRGKGIAQEMYGTSQAYSMHDGYGGYTKVIASDKQLYCWAHLLRFCFEETVNQPPGSDGVHIRDQLVTLYRLKTNPAYSDQPLLLEQTVDRQMAALLAAQTTDPTANILLRRLRQQHMGLVRALVVSPNGTNNLAEQELRPIALARKISYGSDTFAGMETTAVLASIIQTHTRTRPDRFFSSLSSDLRAGFANS